MVPVRTRPPCQLDRGKQVAFDLVLHGSPTIPRAPHHFAPTGQRTRANPTATVGDPRHRGNGDHVGVSVVVAKEPNGDRHDRVADATGEPLLAGKPKVEMTARKVQRAGRRIRLHREYGELDDGPWHARGRPSKATVALLGLQRAGRTAA